MILQGGLECYQVLNDNQFAIGIGQDAPEGISPTAALEAMKAEGDTFSETELARQRAEEQEERGVMVACGGFVQAGAPRSRTLHRVYADFTGADPRFRGDFKLAVTNSDATPEPCQVVIDNINEFLGRNKNLVRRAVEGEFDPKPVKVSQPTGYPDGNPKTAAGMKKPDLSVVPPVALLHLATAMMNGANKYGPFNWRDQPISYRPYLAAAMRHLASCLDGEDFSADTVEAGLPVHHLGHVMACCAILLDAIHCETITDNRPKVPGKTGEAIERYNSDKVLLG